MEFRLCAIVACAGARRRLVIYLCWSGLIRFPTQPEPQIYCKFATNIQSEVLYVQKDRLFDGVAVVAGSRIFVSAKYLNVVQSAVLLYGLRWQLRK